MEKFVEEDRSRSMKQKKTELIREIGDPPLALKELVNKHRPDLVEKLPGFWERFSDLGKATENPSQVLVDLNQDDASIIQILISCYRDPEKIPNQSIDVSGTLLFYSDADSIQVSGNGNAIFKNAISDALASLLIILHLMEIMGWDFNK